MQLTARGVRDRPLLKVIAACPSLVWKDCQSHFLSPIFQEIQKKWCHNISSCIQLANGTGQLSITILGSSCVQSCFQILIVHCAIFSQLYKGGLAFIDAYTVYPSVSGKQNG